MIDPFWKEETMGFVMFNGQRISVYEMNEYVRVYNNGQRVTLALRPEEIEDQLSYDRDNRPGCAVFLNSICTQAGYLSMERCVAIARELYAGVLARNPIEETAS